MNAFLVVPAALFCLLIYLWMGQQTQVTASYEALSPLKVMPYLAVIIAAVMGMNVMAVLTLGILLTGAIGLGAGEVDVMTWLQQLNEGILNMGELIIITILAAGLLEVVAANGGIDALIEMVTRRVKGKRGAEGCIALLVALVNCCTANNTVAIITVGNIAKKIGDRYGVDNRKCASILDTMSCCVQGMIPYGVQVLMAAGLASVNPVSIVPYLYYPLCIGVATSLSILLRLPRRYS